MIQAQSTSAEKFRSHVNKANNLVLEKQHSADTRGFQTQQNLPTSTQNSKEIGTNPQVNENNAVPMPNQNELEDSGNVVQNIEKQESHTILVQNQKSSDQNEQ